MKKNIYDVNIDLLEKLEPYALYVVGSLARHEDDPKDIDYITIENLNKIAKKIPDDDINELGNKHLNFNYEGYTVDIWRAKNIDELKTMFIMKIIDKTHNIAYRKLAKKKGWKLNDLGLFDEKGNKIYFKDEQELRKILEVKDKQKS